MTPSCRRAGLPATCLTVHPTQPGDTITLPDMTWEVVKTNHTENRTARGCALPTTACASGCKGIR
jgi:hypothetical protein